MFFLYQIIVSIHNLLLILPIVTWRCSIMDRTEVSGTSSAGSIPAGATSFLIINKKRLLREAAFCFYFAIGF
jgi:hypothetical protein